MGMLQSMVYPRGKNTRAGAGMGTNLYPHVGMSFLSGIVRVGGCVWQPSQENTVLSPKSIHFGH
jgi:hypothetical protein